MIKLRPVTRLFVLHNDASDKAGWGSGKSERLNI